jgi:hypothetical protein
MTVTRSAGVRGRIRRAVRGLPAPAQLLVKRARAAVEGDDWVGRVRRQRRRDAGYRDQTTRASRQLPARRRILIVTLQTSTPWLDIECCLAEALRLRGHDVRGVLCDGIMPVCEMNLGRQERPPCDVCVGWLSRYYERAFGFACSRLTGFLSLDDRVEAQRLVEAAGPQPSSAFTVEGVEIGRLAWRELQRYHRGYVFDPAADPMFRQWLVVGVLLVKLYGRLIERERPDIVAVSSGRTLMAASICAVARAKGVRVVTWDTEPSFPDGMVFSHERAAVELPLDEAWARTRCQPLTAAERARLTEFLGRWARGENTPFPYNPAPLTDPAAVRRALGLRDGAPLVAAFGNAAWDMAAIDRDVGFTSMFDWLFSLVDYAAAHPGVDVVIRAHPAETNVPADLRSQTPVCDEIRRRRAPLPPNLLLVPGDNPVSSYVLAAMADVPMVYASRLGLEIALSGKRPWVAGEVTYRGKGFTRDLTSREQMVARLDAGALPETLSADEVTLAERFAYLWFFRYVVRLPLMRPPGGRFVLDSFRQLGPGGDAVLDRLCDAFVTDAPFVDLAPGSTSA